MGRKKRLNKEKSIFEKEVVSINFEVPVIRAIEEKERKTGASKSELVNALCRRVFMTDVEYFREQEKQILSELARVQYERKAAEDRQYMEAIRNIEDANKEVDVICQN
jgi:hypothetical protein